MRPTPGESIPKSSFIAMIIWINGGWHLAGQWKLLDSDSLLPEYKTVNIHPGERDMLFIVFDKILNT